MKRILANIFIIILFITEILVNIQSSSALNAFSIDNCGEILDVFPSASGCFYVLTNYGNSYKILTVYTDGNTSDTVINVPVDSSVYAYSCDNFYFAENSFDFDNDSVNKHILINKYECSDGFLSKYIINNAEYITNGTFAVDSNENYCFIGNLSVNIYSNKFLFKRSISFDSPLINLSNSPNGETVYFTNGQNLIVQHGDNASEYDLSVSKLFMCTDNYLSDNNGVVYQCDGTSLSEIYNGFDSTHGVGVLNENCLIGIKNSRLIAYSDGNEILLNESINNAYITSSNSVCAYFTQNGNSINLGFITENDVENLKETQNSNLFERTDDSQNPITSDSYSQTYIFDSRNGIVTGIEPQCTISEFKNNINVDKSKISVFKADGSRKTSGTIATNYSVEITANNTETYRIIVFGDISGEGNINNNDISKLTDYLMEIEQLDSNSLLSADINNDNAVDLKDLVALDKYIHGNYEITQKRIISP